MRSNNLKKILALAIASSVIFGNVSVYANNENVDTIESSVNINEDNNEEGKNLALNKSVQSSCIENHELGAYNLTNGLIDRKNLKERWSSSYDADKPWVTIDLGKATKFNEVAIEWERRNVTSYEIQGSNDNINWTVIKKLGKPNSLRDTVNFQDQEYRYLRVQVKTYGEDGAWGEIPWLIVSIYEVEVYNKQEVIGIIEDNKVLNIEDIKKVDIVNKKVVEKPISEFVHEELEARKVKLQNKKLFDDKWFLFDTGQFHGVDKSVIEWKDKEASHYKVRLLNDNLSWKSAYVGDKSPPRLLNSIAV